ncbi:MAG: hypothetical protein KAQ83_01095 [Nanoarchaeota archaeon]|nr:hypothetical protein [Nanoarchaeota archaeon]
MNNFYVCVKEPEDLRNHLLSCTKGILHSLQNYEDYKDIKAKKDAYTLRLKENIEQIKVLSQRLFAIMPEVDETIEPIIVKKKVKMSVSDLNKEIEEIEKKISEMGL